VAESNSGNDGNLSMNALHANPIASISSRKLLWVGPATVVAAVAAVAIVQRITRFLIEPVPAAFRFPMTSLEPLVLTAFLVVGAVIVFAVVADMASDPIRTYRRIAFGVLLVSFVPNVLTAVSWGDWQPPIALAAMHVAAWAVTVVMLTRLTIVDERAV
jgi:hypothetical protein